MRHRKTFNHLGRKTGHRKAMLANMASSLILHKRIKTTTAKAKALKMYVEPLITKTKGLDSITEKTHAQRVVFSYLKDKKAVNELFVEVAPKIENRNGGYTRIIKLGNRMGDNADICYIELVDFNDTMLAAKEDNQKGASKRKRRRGGSGSGKKEDAAAVTATTESKEKVEAAESTKPAEVNETVEETMAENVETKAPEVEVAEETEKSEEDETKDDSEKKEG